MAAWETAPVVGDASTPAWQTAPLEPTTPWEITTAREGSPEELAPAADLLSVAGLRKAMAPEPGYVPTGVLPFSLRETTPGSGVADPTSGLAGMHWDWGPVRGVVNPVLDLLEGTGQATSVGGPDAPLAGKVSPQATGLLLGGMMGNPNPFQSRGRLMASPGASIQFGGEYTPGPGVDARAAPLSSEFRTAPMSPEGRAAAEATQTAPTAPSTPTGIPVQTPPMPPRPAGSPVAPEAPPPVGTSAYAKHVASAYYDIADKSGGTLTPQVTNKFIDSVSTADKQTKAGKLIAGQNVVSRLAEDLKGLRDEPLTLRAAQEVDESLGDLIDKEFTSGRLSKDGQRLVQVQSDFRDMIENAGEGDITGGTAGFDALGPARKAWSQARKMDDLERIQQRADLTDNPATSVRTQIRTLITSKTKSRGYSPEEIAALEEAANRGVVGGALHVFGSRLVPLVAGGFGLATGPVTAAAYGGAAHVVSSALRAGATGIATRRLNRAIDVLGEGIPQNPMAPSPDQPIPPPYRNKMAPRKY